MTKALSQLEIGERGGQARKVPIASSLQPGWGLGDPGMLSEVPGTLIPAKFTHSSCSWKGLPMWLSGKESTCQCRTHGFDSWVGKIPWRREWQPTPIFLPRKSHGQRSLAGFSPWGRKESHKNERLTLSLSPSLLRLCVSYTHGASLS